MSICIGDLENIGPLGGVCIVFNCSCSYYIFLNGPVIVYYTQRRKLIIVYSLLNHDCPTFASHENLLNKNIVRTEGIQIPLYLIMSSISLVRHCCFYLNMVYINSTVNVKQKQT